MLWTTKEYMRFDFHSGEEGGDALLKTLTVFQTKICDFLYHILEMTQYFQHELFANLNLNVSNYFHSDSFFYMFVYEN